jgi:hypothetical protein
VLEALDWVRRELMNRGSPDFIRQRELARGTRQLASRLLRCNPPSGAKPCQSQNGERK